MSTLYYLAYGSNLHPLRLRQRIPSSCFVTTLKLSGYLLSFHKRGICDSGKCNLIHTAVDSDVAYAALYKISADEKAILDQFEGKGYRVENFKCELSGSTVTAFVYIAEDDYIDDTLKPFHWYKEVVYYGGHYHQMPESYLQAIQGVESSDDIDAERDQQHRQLITEMQSFKL